VCDGHGLNGHMVSSFVKKAFPQILGSLIETHFNSDKDKSPKRTESPTKNSESTMLPPLTKLKGVAPVEDEKKETP